MSTDPLEIAAATSAATTATYFMTTEPCCRHPLPAESTETSQSACCLCGRVFVAEKPTMLYVDTIDLEALRQRVGAVHLRKWKGLAL